MNNDVSLCNGIFSKTDATQIFHSLGAIIDIEKETVTIPRKNSNIVVSLEDFEAALSDWLSVDCVRVMLYKRLVGFVNSKTELGQFVDFLSSFIE